MGVEYIVYSPLTVKQLERVLKRCEAQIEVWSEARRDYDDQWGELALTGGIPTEEEALEMIWVDEELVTDGKHPTVQAILHRLPRLRSAVSIDRPGDFETSPMQVSIMRFLIAEAGEGLVQMVDALMLSEDLLAELEGYPDVDTAGAKPVAEAQLEPPPTGASGAVLLKFVVERTKQLILSGAFELHPLANPRALAEDILDYLYARDPRPNAADFMEWLLERGDIEEVFGDDDEIYGQFVAS